MNMKNFTNRLAQARAKAKKKPKLGTGERFAALKKTLSNRPGVKTPGALAAYIGRKKYGNKKFNKLATAGKA